MPSKKLLIILTLAVLALAAIAINPKPKEQKPSLQIGNVRLEVEIADTDAARARGLSGRAALAENNGLLFVFDSPAKPGFWMKDMNFPIDIIWIDENWRIVGVTSNVPPDSYPQIFYPPAPIKYALEVNTGFAITHHLSIGTQMVSK